MHYNYTFQAYRLEKHQKDYLHSSEDVSIWNWIQLYKPKRIFQKKSKVSEFIIIDETLIKKLVMNTYGYGLLLSQ
jgi:hypothetical protein